MPDLSSENAHLVGLLADTFASGLYIAYLPQSIAVLRRKWRAGLPIWLPLCCAIIFVLEMGDWWTELVLGYQAFSLHPGQKLANPSATYHNISNPVTLAKGVFTAALAMFSDLIIVHRALIIWNYNLLVAFLTIGLLLASYGVGAWSVWTEFQTGTVSVGILAAEVTVRVRYFFIITFALNILCAALISWKIWRVTRRTAKHIHGNNPVAQVMSIVIETAAIYCANLLALIISSFVQSNTFFIFLQMLPAVNAITFTMLWDQRLTTLRFGSSANDTRFSRSAHHIETGISLDQMSVANTTARFDGSRADDESKFATAV
ncbi:uncharacterized protein BXZ73DRAFT_95868 [Epithele typhae]|uniref:uncharacterized protein n=1 Tax=Epithele typhae TaxID=378194 RepID=UPI0020085834|nr:uncharacterized protein BXZ73DRAFT_95868 [Epithele typhae]KAH9946370.1 hypothetical protein BXZ73DRAFT_95868 [Epithele typhae]